MKIHTTNYEDTLVEVAEDCPAETGEVPPAKGSGRTAALIQFEIISGHPYKFTSDDVLFQVFAEKNDLTEEELPAARQLFFSKGQPCFRASPLPKRYGWGVHSDKDGKIALYGCETEEYRQLLTDENTKKVRAMKSRR